MSEESKPASLGIEAAYQLSDVTKTTAQYQSLTPRWLTRVLEWKGLETGIFRRNRVVEDQSPLEVLCSQIRKETVIPQTFIDYEEKPREYVLNSISAIINIDTRISDIYSVPHNQIREQLRLAIESIRERQEGQLINNDDYGLLRNVPDSQRIQSRTGFPTPDDFDELISRVWKEPSFFLAHPRAIAAFGRECTRRGVPPATVDLFGSHFLTWRGIPIFPTNKLLVDGVREPKGKAGKTDILLVRTGEANQGVIGLYQKNLPDEQSRGLSVKFRGIDDKGIASYLLSIYCSVAILSDDAVAVLEDVDIGNYYDYN